MDRQPNRSLVGDKICRYLSVLEWVCKQRSEFSTKDLAQGIEIAYQNARVWVQVLRDLDFIDEIDRGTQGNHIGPRYTYRRRYRLERVGPEVHEDSRGSSKLEQGYI